MANPTSNRRRSGRYPVEVDLWYRVLDAAEPFPSGHGRTLDLSEAGVLFRPDQKLRSGLKLEVAICWAARSRPAADVRVYAIGRVVRTDKECVAIEFFDHEFRTEDPTGRSSPASWN
jgi:hypothetical protein